MIEPSSARLMKFHQRSPSRQLSPWVQRLWYRAAGTGLVGSEKLYPDAGASLTISLESSGPLITIFCNRRTFLEPLEAPAARLGIRFKPAGACALLGLPAQAFTDAPYRLPDSVHPPGWCSSLMRIVERLYLLEAHDSLDLLETWLHQILTRQSLAPSRTTELVDTLGLARLSPQQFSERLGLSQRTLERLLRREVGASYGQLVAFARLKHARGALIDTRRPLADIALDCGFHDQAHFTHAFKSLALETPAAYRRRKLSQIYKA